MELLGSDNFVFPDVNFCPIQTITWTFTFAYGTMLGREYLSYYLLHYTENDNSEFFQAYQSL